MRVVMNTSLEQQLGAIYAQGAKGIGFRYLPESDPVPQPTSRFNLHRIARTARAFDR